MRRYKNFVMLEQMKDYIRSGQQDAAIEIADSLDVHLIKSNTDVNLMADLYIENGMYDKGFSCLRELHDRKKSRSVLMQLINLSVRMKNANAAEKYYSEYKEISGKDFYNHIFRYNIDKIKGKPIETLIDSLEKLKDEEYIEVWAYELAKLYHKAELADKCVKECDDIEIWFGDGPYVERARALKAYYKGEISLDGAGGKAPAAPADTARDKRSIKEPETAAEPVAETADLAEKEENLQDAPENRQEKEEFRNEAYTVKEGSGDEAYTETESGNEAYAGEEEGFRNDAIPETGEEIQNGSVAVTEEEPQNNPDVREEDLRAGTYTVTEMEEYPQEAAGSGNNGTGTTEISESGNKPENTGNSPEIGTETSVDSFTTQVDETEDDFAEEIKDFEEETAVETAGINISTNLVEGDEALINSFLEEEESELAQMIRIEFEKEKASELRLTLERKDRNNTGSFTAQKEPEENRRKEPETGSEAGTETASETGFETGNKAEPETGFETGNKAEPETGTETDSEAETEEEFEDEPETVSFDFGSKDVKEIEPESLLGQFLKKREETFEDYFEFYAYQAEVRSQLIKSLEILLNPQIKNICVVVTGSAEPEKNVIIRGIARLLFNSGYLEHKQIFNSEAVKLTREDLKSKVGKLIGSCFVIREAGKMNRETAEALLEINDEFTGRTAVMLTDERSGISSLFRDNRELNSMFPLRIHMPEFKETDIEEMAYYKLQDSGLQLAKDAQPELINIIRGYLRSEKNPVKKVQDLIVAVIDEVETRNARAFLSKGTELDFRENYIVRVKDLKKFAV